MPSDFYCVVQNSPCIRRKGRHSMRMHFPQAVSDRIAMLRPLLIIGVVFVHIRGISDIPSEIGPGLFDGFAAFFKNALFRGTVPTMSLIAGFLLFSAGLDRTPAKLFKKKALTLAVPFLLFNLYAFLFMATMHAGFGQVSTVLARMQASGANMLTMFLGIDGYPVNGPLHFVRDMLVTIAMVPLLSICIRHFPVIGLVALALFFGQNLDGHLIFRASSLVLFYIGGIAAVYKWDVLALDRLAKPCLALLIGVCLAYTVCGIDDSTVLVTVLPFLIWPAAALLRQTRLETWALGFSKYSFFIFVAHMPMTDSLWWMVSNHARWIPYPVFWFGAPALTVTLLAGLYQLAMRVAPGAFSVAIGARGAAGARAARAAPVPIVNRRRIPRPRNAPVYSPEMRARLTGR